MKFNKDGNIISEKIKYPIKHKDYWQNQIDSAIKEYKEHEFTLSEIEKLDGD